MDTAGKSGEVRKEVRVYSNDASLPVQSVFARVEVVRSEVASATTGAVSPLFRDGCAECHALPAAGLQGRELYEAVCAMCHGEQGRGGSASRLVGVGEARLASVTADGDVAPGMPGYSSRRGGPLDDAQLMSLVTFLGGLR